MNESVDLLPFGGGALIGRKRRALAALCLLARAGAALVLGVTLIIEPKQVLAEFGYNQGVAARESDVLVEQLLGVWICTWALFSVYTIGLGSVQDKKMCAAANAAATLLCVFLASSHEGINKKRNLTSLYLVLGVLVLLTDGLTFFLCGAGPRMIRVGENTWLRLNSGEDDFKDPLLGGGFEQDRHGEVTTIRRINSHTQLFTRGRVERTKTE